jgi:hypothetical protein
MCSRPRPSPSKQPKGGVARDGTRDLALCSYYFFFSVTFALPTMVIHACHRVPRPVSQGVFSIGYCSLVILNGAGARVTLSAVREHGARTRWLRSSSPRFASQSRVVV